MDIMQAIKERHAVRKYTDKAIEPEKQEALKAAINECNAKSGLHIQLITDEPKAFDCMLAHGKFSGVKNYIAMIGKDDGNFKEKCGYYGEELVLKAQMMGLNTCWVAASYKKIPEAFDLAPGEKIGIVISIGYGETQGNPHKIKTPEQVSNVTADSPEWFKKGVEAALLAPTALNQQKFKLELTGEKVKAKAGSFLWTKTDLGIVKYHFEIGSGKDSSVWA